METNEQVLAELRNMRDKLVRIEAQTEPKEEAKPKNWVETVSAFALMIAALLGIYSTVLGWDKDSVEIEQGPFKIQEAQLKVQKLELEVEEKLRALQKDDPDGVLGNAQETRELLVDIQGTLSALSKAQSNLEVGNLLVPFIFIWAFLGLIGIAESTVTTFWSYVLLAVHSALQSFLAKRKRSSKLVQFFVRLIEIIVAQLPSLLFLFLRVLMFGGVVIPFLFQISALSPIQAGLQAAIEAALEFHPFEAIDTLSSLLGAGR